jgi:enoyl-CoA hydratase/carnithine racemase
VGFVDGVAEDLLAAAGEFAARLADRAPLSISGAKALGPI